VFWNNAQNYNSEVCLCQGKKLIGIFIVTFNDQWLFTI